VSDVKVTDLGRGGVWTLMGCEGCGAWITLVFLAWDKISTFRVTASSFEFITVRLDLKSSIREVMRVKSGNFDWAGGVTSDIPMISPVSSSIIVPSVSITPDWALIRDQSICSLRFVIESSMPRYSLMTVPMSVPSSALTSFKLVMMFLSIAPKDLA